MSRKQLFALLLAALALAVATALGSRVGRRAVSRPPPAATRTAGAPGAAGLPGPAGPTGAPGAAAAPELRGELTVFAAASLREAFEQAAARFERAHPGAHVSFAFGGSQQLRLQIEQGAAADVFASADLRQADALRASGLLLPPRIFARNALALVVPRENPAGVHALSDLPRASRIVIAGPEVPAGRYTEQLLRAAGTALGARFEAEVRARVVSREPDVRQVLAKVALGEADAGVVYRTDARAAAGKVEQIELPEALNQTAAYPIAAAVGTRAPALAAAFVEQVLSPEGREELAARGFLAPAPEPAQ